MEEVKEKLSRLLGKDEWTLEDKQWLITYLEQTKSQELYALMEEEFNKDELVTLLDKESSKQILAGIHQNIGLQDIAEPPRPTLPFYKSIAAAAAVVLCILSAFLIVENKWSHTIASRDIKTKTENRNDPGDGITPGGSKAMLTLADGTTILLDDAKNGTLAKQGKTKVLKFDGRLAYTGSDAGGDETMYNTISTPRGGEYQVVLPDGSKVWLNAASSIHFPISFSGPERRVEITGEAYFEVAKNAAKPFIVKVNTSEVKVLGTHFNIMAYDEEGLLKTTLMEGSVQFNTGKDQVMLKPGQQSELATNGKINVLKDIDAEDAIAWKNGMFHFDNTEVKTMMRQLSRWYDVEIVYEGNKTYDKFVADIPRDLSLQVALKALSLTKKIKFEVEGNTVIVK